MKDEIYPFAIGNKLVRIRGSGFNNALDRVLTRHPNKYVKTKFAKNMVLHEAKDQAKKESLAQKKPFYVFVDKDGEADISSAPLAGTLHKFVNGVEDSSFDYKKAASEKTTKPTLPAQSEKAQKLINKKEQNMEKKSAPKKAAKKVALKKSSPKTPTGDKVIRGNNMALTKAEWAKVDAILKKEEMTFSAWSRSLVLAKIK